MYKRRTSRSSRSVYYDQFRNIETGLYCSGRSIGRLVDLLGLDPREYPATSKASARQVAELWLSEGRSTVAQREATLGDYCLAFWDWEKSDYVKGRHLRDKSIGKEYVATSQSYIRRLLIPHKLGKRPYPE